MTDTTTTPTIDPSAEARKMPDWDRSSARFSAAYLHALEPIIRSSQGDVMSWSTSGLIIEPVETGGAILLATDGRVFAALFDPDAHASRPMRLTIPEATFQAVTPPKPISMWGEGENYQIDLPEWAQPDWVWAWGLAICVIPKMHLPGEDPAHSPMLGSERLETGNLHAGGYRMHPERPTLNWRGLLGRERAPSFGWAAINPEMLSHFGRIAPLFDSPLQFSLGAPNEPIIITAGEAVNFVGMVMPCAVPQSPDAIPAWARSVEAA